MNTIFKRILVLLLLALPCAAIAQQPTSILSQFDTPAPSAAIVRSADTNTVVTYGRHIEQGGPTHQFVVHDLTSGQSREFYLGQTSLVGDYVSQVSDMRILDGVCYFCGEYQKVVDMIDNLDGTHQYLTTPRGLVGWFKVQDVLSGAGDFHLLMIPEAARLVRMTAFVDHGKELALIGDPAAGPQRKLMARVLLTLNPTVTYWAEVLPDDNNLELTDIWGGNGLLAVVMRYSSNLPEDHYRYAVSWNKAMPSPNTLNNLFVVNAPHAQGGSFREFGANLRLCGLNYSDLAVVYPGSRNSTFGYNVHRFSLSSQDQLPMHENQFVKLPSINSHTIEDVSFLPNRKLMPVSLINAYGQTILNWTMLYQTANYSSSQIANGGIEFLSSDALGPRRVVAVGIDQDETPVLSIKKDNWLAFPGFNCLSVDETFGDIYPNIEPRFGELHWNSEEPYQTTIYNFPFRSTRVRHSVQCSLREPLPQINANE